MLLTSAPSCTLPGWSETVPYIMEEVKNLTNFDIKSSQNHWKDPTVRSCFVHSDPNLNFIKRSTAEGWAGDQCTDRKQMGLPEFVSQLQQSTVGSAQEDKQNVSKQGNLEVLS